MRKDNRKTKKTKKTQKINNEIGRETEEVLKFRKEFEESMRNTGKTERKTNIGTKRNSESTLPKSQRGRRMKTSQEIREEMLKKLENSNLK